MHQSWQKGVCNAAMSVLKQSIDVNVETKKKILTPVFSSVFSGISYDKPLPPIQVASQRAERIAKEKKVIVGSVPATAPRCVCLAVCYVTF